jgi:hypothetical protein
MDGTFFSLATYIATPLNVVCLQREDHRAATEEVLSSGGTSVEEGGQKSLRTSRERNHRRGGRRILRGRFETSEESQKSK